MLARENFYMGVFPWKSTKSWFYYIILKQVILIICLCMVGISYVSLKEIFWDKAFIGYKYGFIFQLILVSHIIFQPLVEMMHDKSIDTLNTLYLYFGKTKKSILKSMVKRNIFLSLGTILFYLLSGKIMITMVITLWTVIGTYYFCSCFLFSPKISEFNGITFKNLKMLLLISKLPIKKILSELFKTLFLSIFVGYLFNLFLGKNFRFLWLGYLYALTSKPPRTLANIFLSTFIEQRYLESQKFLMKYAKQCFFILTLLQACVSLIGLFLIVLLGYIQISNSLMLGFLIGITSMSLKQYYTGVALQKVRVGNYKSLKEIKLPLQKELLITLSEWGLIFLYLRVTNLLKLPLYLTAVYLVMTVALKTKIIQRILR
ncbi:hypothetical protein RR45_GL000260 [Lactococcus chungangensis CAU 28 = DSM 22330]|nr:hypothetical protein RR45_GL000260 [Lactococcus chungangensis CAU 28 = DSM 22330]